MKKIVIINLCLAALFASVIGGMIYAAYKAPRFDIDKKIYKEEYYRCINNLPAGPESTVYNDWDEVMEECQYLAQKFSSYCTNC